MNTNIITIDSQVKIFSLNNAVWTVDSIYIEDNKTYLVVKINNWFETVEASLAVLANDEEITNQYNKWLAFRKKSKINIDSLDEIQEEDFQTYQDEINSEEKNQSEKEFLSRIFD